MKFLNILFGILTLLLAHSIVFADNVQAPAMPLAAASPAQLPVDQMRAATYTKAFAKRFVLPDPVPGTEPMDGVQAIEYGMWLAKGKGQIDDIGELRTYDCELSIYFDNTLPIAWPEEARASTSTIPSPSTRPPLLFTWTRERFLKVSAQDRKKMDERWTRYLNLAQLVVTDAAYDKTGSMTSADWVEYDREAFADLAYAKLSIGCSMTDRVIESALRQKGRVSLWLKHTKASGYIKTDNPRPDEVVKLRLPQEFIERVLPWIKAGATYNAQSIAEHDRINRDQRASRAAKQIDKDLARGRDPGKTKQLLDLMKRMDDAAQGRR